MTTPGVGFLNDAGRALTESATRFQRKRRQRVRALQSAVVLVPLIVIGALMFWPRGAEAGSVQITSANGQVRIAIIDPNAPVSEIEAHIRAARIPVSERSGITGPSRVGKFLGITGDAGGSSYTVQVRFGDGVEVVVGTAATLGEPYEFFTDAFAVGEPLACLGGSGADAASIAARVKTGVQIEWRDNKTARRLQVSELANRNVESASAISSNSVIISVNDGAGAKKTIWC